MEDQLSQLFAMVAFIGMAILVICWAIVVWPKKSDMTQAEMFLGPDRTPEFVHGCNICGALVWDERKHYEHHTGRKI